MKKAVTLALALGLYARAFAEAPDASFHDFPWLGENFQKESDAALARGKRAPAQDRTASESMMSQDAKRIRDRLLAIKTPEEIDPILTELEEKYDGYPDDAKFAAAQLIPLRTFKAMVWRVTPAIENANAKVAHSALISFVRGVASGVRIHFPMDPWVAERGTYATPKNNEKSTQYLAADAVFKYLVEPAPELPRFKTASAIQNYLATTVMQATIQSARRIAKLDLKSKPIVFDNKVFMGPSSFQDDLDRFSLITEAERNATLAGLHAGAAALAAQCAYSVEGSFQLTEDLGKLVGFDAFTRLGELDGAPASDRVAKFRKARYAKTFTLREGGQQWLQLSLSHLRESVKRTRLVWNEIKNRKVDDAYAILNPAQILPFTREIELSLKNVEALVSGPAEIRSALTGEVVKVDITQAYTNPIEDLKDLLPTKFEGGSKTLKKGNLSYRNYWRGSPTDWDLAKYQRVFPGAKDGDDLKRAARVLTQSWGGFGAAVPVALFLQ